MGTIGSIVFSNRGYGSLTDDSGLGAAAADGAVFACGADVAILNGGDLAGNLTPGEKTWDELLFAFSTDRELVTTQVTPVQLYELLELCLAHMTVDMEDLSIDREASAFAGFPQVSGMTVRYDVSAPAGERVVELRTDQGPLDRADTGTTLCLACTRYLLEGGYGPAPDISWEDAGMTECEALADYIAAGKMTGDYTDAERVTAIGVTDDSIASRLGLRGLVLLVCVMVAVVFGSRFRRHTSEAKEDRRVWREFRDLDQ